MQPTKFNGMTKEIAKHQKEYLTLPAHIDDEGVVTSCWRLTIGERLRTLFTGKMYLQTMTFKQPLQPQKLITKNPVAV